jgi:hypothetical protein
MTADDGGVEIFQQPNGAREPSGVGCELEEVHPVRDRDRAGEIGQEDGAGLEWRDEQRLAAGVGGGQLEAQLPDTVLDLAAGEVDLSDRMAVGREQAGEDRFPVGYDASFSCNR